MTAPTLVSVSAFARLHGVSKAAAQKWEARGYLVMREGKVWTQQSDRNLEHAGLGRYGQVAAERQPVAATGNQVAAVVAAPKLPRDEAGALDLEEPDTIKTLDLFVEQLLGGTYADAMTAATVKENALALTRVLEARKAAGQLIELEIAEQVLFEEFRSARDAWLGFPARIGATLASDLNVDADRLIEALTAHVQQQLEDLGEPDADFHAAQEGAA